MTPAHEELLRRLAINDDTVLETVLSPVCTNAFPSSLDAKASGLLRLAALIASEAGGASYEWGVANAQEAGATDEDIVAVLVAIAPVVGLARVVTATPRLAKAMGYDVDHALELLDDQDEWMMEP
jgi:4-carboxymuconolactone decarboxylase